MTGNDTEDTGDNHASDELTRELRRKVGEWRQEANRGIGPHSRGEVHVYEKAAGEVEEILNRHVESETVVERKPHGRGGTVAGNTQCLECGAHIGELHEPGCDWEQCPKCGQQLIACDHGREILNG